MSKNIDIIIPKYKLAEKEEEKDLSPVKKTIFKTMQVTETFTLYSVLEYVAKMDKAIADKQAEVDGLVNMKKAYLEELRVIEEQLGLKGLEEEYMKEALEAANKAATEVKDAKKEENN